MFTGITNYFMLILRREIQRLSEVNIILSTWILVVLFCASILLMIGFV